MAKEKYIFAFEVDTNEDLYNNFTPCIGCDCAYCEDECLTHKKPMPRKEVIECMSLAMHNEEIKRSIKDVPCDYRNLAEAALNAIVSIIQQEEEE
jgi:hypothetical protein